MFPIAVLVLARSAPIHEATPIVHGTHEATPTAQVIGTPPASNANAHHYGNPTGGCKSDEISTYLSGTSGDVCAPNCDSGKACPSDMPSNVTAHPYCGLTEGPHKYCLLECMSSAECGPGASCKNAHPPTYGICTYDPPKPHGQTHYGDPSHGCLSDEQAIRITGVSGSVCSPACNSTQQCPSDVRARARTGDECRTAGDPPVILEPCWLCAGAHQHHCHAKLLDHQLVRQAVLPVVPRRPLVDVLPCGGHLPEVESRPVILVRHLHLRLVSGRSIGRSAIPDRHRRQETRRCLQAACDASRHRYHAPHTIPSAQWWLWVPRATPAEYLRIRNLRARLVGFVFAIFGF